MGMSCLSPCWRSVVARIFPLWAWSTVVDCQIVCGPWQHNYFPCVHCRLSRCVDHGSTTISPVYIVGCQGVCGPWQHNYFPVYIVGCQGVGGVWQHNYFPVYIVGCQGVGGVWQHNCFPCVHCRLSGCWWGVATQLFPCVHCRLSGCWWGVAAQLFALCSWSAAGRCGAEQRETSMRVVCFLADFDFAASVA